MHAYWENSWKSIDPERVAHYVQTVADQPDELIDRLHRHGAYSVCDAGCGCGIYARKLAAARFAVSGFDLSAHAVEIACRLLDDARLTADLKPADICATGYAEHQFDGVLSRDVLDHLPRQTAISAIKELLRITKPGGILLFTLDPLDEEYLAQPHVISADGDYVYTDGKWKGMVFHPYTAETARKLLPFAVTCSITENDGALTVEVHV